MTIPKFPLPSMRPALLALALCGAASGALAQYKIVAPDGSVTYTDKPPVGAAPAPRATGNAGGGGLPYATRQAMGKYPVTLYAGRNCAPCDHARQYLRDHGVPYSEYSVVSNQDGEALKSRFGGTTLPVITVGSQPLKGYNSADLGATLEAAGYPAQAHLAGYAWPAAVPLAPPSPKKASAPAPAPTPAPAPAPASGGGIQF